MFTQYVMHPFDSESERTLSYENALRSMKYSLLIMATIRRMRLEDKSMEYGEDIIYCSIPTVSVGP